MKITKIFTDNTNDLPLYIADKESVKDLAIELKDNEYFIILESNTRHIILYTREMSYHYNKKTFLNIFNDLENFKTKNPDSIYVKIPNVRTVYTNKQLIEYSLSEIKLYLCIPYMSRISKEHIKKTEFKISNY